MLLGTPLLLGSPYGILAGLALTVLLIARTRGEEAMLGRELEGYREYTQNVRYRLFPLSLVAAVFLTLFLVMAGLVIR